MHAGRRRARDEIGTDDPQDRLWTERSGGMVRQRGRGLSDFLVDAESDDGDFPIDDEESIISPSVSSSKSSFHFVNPFPASRINSTRTAASHSTSPQPSQHWKLSVTSWVIGGVVAFYSALSILISYLFALIGLPLQSLMPPVLLLLLTLYVLVKPRTLASFICGGVNVVASKLIGVDCRTEVQGIDILRRRVEHMSVLFQKKKLLQVEAITLEFSSSALNPFHGKARPLLTLYISGVELNLFSEFLQTIMSRSMSSRENRQANARDTKTDDRKSNSKGEEQKNKKKNKKSKQGSDADKLLSRLVWLGGFVVLELDKATISLESEQTSLAFRMSQLVISCSKQQQDKESAKLSPVTNVLVAEPKLSVGQISLDLQVGNTALPLLFFSNFCTSAALFRRATRQDMFPYLCHCMMKRDEPVEKTQAAEKTTQIRSFTFTADFLDVFTSRKHLEALSILAFIASNSSAAAASSSSSIPPSSSLSSSSSQSTNNSNNTENLAQLSAAKRIELSQQQQQSQTQKQENEGLDHDTGSEYSSRSHSESDVSLDSAGWECMSCSFSNSPEDRFCSVCKAPWRPEQNDGEAQARRVQEFYEQYQGLESDEEDDFFQQGPPTEKTVQPGSVSTVECLIGRFLDKAPSMIELSLGSVLVSVQGDGVSPYGVNQGGSARLQTGFKLSFQCGEKKPPARLTDVQADTVLGSAGFLLQSSVSSFALSIQQTSLEKLVSSHLSLRESGKDLLTSEISKSMSVFSCESLRIQSDVSLCTGTKDLGVHVAGIVTEIVHQDDSLLDETRQGRAESQSATHVDSAMLRRSSDSSTGPNHDWECANCRFDNEAGDRVCRLCQTPFQAVVVRAPEWDPKQAAEMALRSTDESKTDSKEAGQAPIVPPEHHHDLNADTQVSLSKVNVSLNATMWENLSSIGAAFKGDETEEVVDEANYLEKKSDLSRHPGDAAERGSIVSSSSKASSSILSAVFSNSTTGAESNMKARRAAQQRRTESDMSKRQPAFLKALWQSEVIGISFTRHIQLSFSVEPVQLLVAPVSRDVFHSPFSSAKLPRRLEPCRLSLSQESFLVELQVEHSVPSAVDSWTYSRQNRQGHSSVNPQNVFVILKSKIGSVSVSQLFDTFELEERNKLLRMLPQGGQRQQHDTRKPQTTGKSKKSFRLLSLSGPLEVTMSTLWERPSDVPRRLACLLDCQQGSKFHFFGGSWLRIAALGVEFREEMRRVFFPPIARAKRPQANKKSASSTSSSGASRRKSNQSAWMGSPNSTKSKDRVSSERWKKVKLLFRTRLGKLNLYLHANESMLCTGHVLRISIPQLNIISTALDKIDLSLERLAVSLAPQRIERTTATFETILKVSSVTLNASLSEDIHPQDSAADQQQLQKPQIKPSNTKQFQHKTLEKSKLIRLKWQMSSVRILQGPGIEFGNALQALLQQRKALREGLRRLLLAVRDPTGSHLSSVTPPDAASSSGAKASARVRVLFELNLEDFDLRFKNDDEWTENPEILKFAPKKSTTPVPFVALIVVQNVHLELSWENRKHSREGLLEMLWRYDDCPSEQIARAVHSHGFSFITGFTLDALDAGHIMFQLRNHRRPMVELWGLSLSHATDVVLAEINGTEACTSEVSIILSEAFPSGFLHDPNLQDSQETDMSNMRMHPLGIRFDGLRRLGVPTKLYYNLNISCEQLSVAHGDCLSAAMNAFDAALSRALPKSSDKRSPKLGFWDKLRYMYHGLVNVRAKRASVRILTLSPWHGDTGLLIRGRNLHVRNVREINQLATESNTSMPLSGYSRASRFSNMRRRSSSQTSDASHGLFMRDLMDWSSKTHHEQAAAEKGSSEKQIGTKGQAREWELIAESFTLSTIRDDQGRKVDQYVLLTIPIVRLEVSLNWGTDPHCLDHYVQFHHPPGDNPATIQDMYKKFRSRGLDLGLKFELGCSRHSEQQQQPRSGKSDSPRSPGSSNVKSVDAKAGNEGDEMEEMEDGEDAVPEDDDEETCCFPALTLCWSSYVAISEILRSFSPPGPPKTAKDRATFGRLLTHLKIGVLADRPRVLWWEEPTSEAALLVHAKSLLTKMEFYRVASDALTSDEESFWSPPYGIPPPWKQHALLIQCPNIAGHFLPRALPPDNGSGAAILLEGRTYVDASGCGWRFWSSFPVHPDLDKLNAQVDDTQLPFVAEPWVSSPAFMLKSGKWRELVATKKGGASSGKEEDLEDGEADEVFTIVLDECRMTWTLNVRDAIFMVIGSTLYAVRQQWKVDEGLRKEENERQNLLQTKSRSMSSDDLTSLNTSMDNIRSPRTGGSFHELGSGTYSLASESGLGSPTQTGDEEAMRRPEEFDGHFEGPLIDLAGVYAPVEEPSANMAELLEQSEDQAFKTREVFPENYVPSTAQDDTEYHGSHRGGFEGPEEDDVQFPYKGEDGGSFGQDSPHFEHVSESMHHGKSIGDLSFVVKLRWAQVQLRAGSSRTFVTAESAEIKSFKNMLECFHKVSGEQLDNFEMIQREVDVQVVSAQIFVPPPDLDRAGPTAWLSLRPETAELCFSEKLSDYAFSFQQHEFLDMQSSTGGSRQPLLFDPDKESSKPHPVLQKTDFSIREISYTIFPLGTEEKAAKLSDVRVPTGLFLIDVPTVYFRLGSYEFFNVLGVIRDLLVVMPSPDYTGMIKSEISKDSVAENGDLRWFRNMDGTDVTAGDSDEEEVDSGGRFDSFDLDYEDDEVFAHESDDEARWSSGSVGPSKSRRKALSEDWSVPAPDGELLGGIDTEALRLEAQKVLQDVEKASIRSPVNLTEPADSSLPSSAATSPERRSSKHYRSLSGDSVPVGRSVEHRQLLQKRSMSRRKLRDRIRSRGRTSSKSSTESVSQQPHHHKSGKLGRSAQMVASAEEDLIRSGNDTKVLQKHVDAILACRSKQKEGRKSELVYQVGQVTLVMLMEKESKERDKDKDKEKPQTEWEQPVKGYERVERVHTHVAGLRGSHVFAEDGSSKVQVSVNDLRVIDCAPPTGSQGNDGQPQDILSGSVVNLGSSNKSGTVPILRVDATTKPYVLLGDFKVNVYDMLQFLLYPGAPAYRLSLFLTYEVAMFLINYFNSEDEEEETPRLGDNRAMGESNIENDRQVADWAESHVPTSSSDILLKQQQQSQQQQPHHQHQVQSHHHHVHNEGVEATWILRSGWILKRGRSDISWATGRVRRNYCQLRIRLENRKPVVVFEYYRNELETRLRIPPRGSVPLSKIVSVSFSRDMSAPRHAIDLVVLNATDATSPRSGLRSPSQRTITYTFAPDLSSRRSHDLDPRAYSVEWVAAMKPLLSEQVIDEELVEFFNKDNVAHLEAISRSTVNIVSSHEARSGFVVDASAVRKHDNSALGTVQSGGGQGSLITVGKRQERQKAAQVDYSMVDLFDEENYIAFLVNNENRRFLLSTRRASALGLMTREAIRLASGDYTDRVYLRYVRISPLFLSLGCQGFPWVRKFANKRAECPAFIIHLKLFSWQKFFKHLRNRLAKSLLKSLIAGGGRARPVIVDSKQQSQQPQQGAIQQSKGGTNSPFARPKLQVPTNAGRKFFLGKIGTSSSTIDAQGGSVGKGFDDSSPISAKESAGESSEHHDESNATTKKRVGSFSARFKDLRVDVSKKAPSPKSARERTTSYDSVVQVDADLSDEDQGEDEVFLLKEESPKTADKKRRFFFQKRR